ncbi:MAG: TolC family protein, partial [Spirochaetota bacterium]
MRIIGALALALVCGAGIGADQAAANPVVRSEPMTMAPLPPSEAGEAVVTLSTALASVLGGNEDVKLLEGNLESARAQHLLNLSRNLPTLSGSAALSLTDGFNDQTQAIKAGASGVGVGGGLSGSLNFVQGAASTTSGTRIGLSITHSNPYSPLSSGTTKVSQPPSTAAALSLSQVVWDGYPGGQSKAIVDKSELAHRKSELEPKQGRS